MPETVFHPDLEDLNIIAEQNGRRVRLVNLSFARMRPDGRFPDDVSLYLRIYSSTGLYRVGRGVMASGEQGMQIAMKPFARGDRDEEPHVSLHQSGQAHVRARNRQTRRVSQHGEPIQLKPLFDFRGEHLFSVGWNHLPSLPEFNEEVIDEVRRDAVVRLHPDFPCGRMVVLVNGEADRFANEQQRIRLHLRRGNNRLYVGAAFFGDERPLDQNSPTAEGLHVLFGFDPLAPLDAPNAALVLATWPH